MSSLILGILSIGNIALFLVVITLLGNFQSYEIYYVLQLIINVAGIDELFDKQPIKCINL